MTINRKALLAELTISTVAIFVAAALTTLILPLGFLQAAGLFAVVFFSMDLITLGMTIVGKYKVKGEAL